MRSGRQRSWRQGFTLVETLVVTAIIVILLAVSAVGVVYYSRWLKITELDNAAREIYLAAENRAVLLSGSDRLEDLVSTLAEGTMTLKEETETEGYYIYYSDGNGPEALLPSGTIDPALMEGSFYIVYEPKSGSVTDVFYAEDELDADIDIAVSFKMFYDKVSTASRSERMKRKPMVGHYGGGMAENSRDDALGTPIVTIINKDTLTAEITYTVLPSMRDKMTLAVMLNYGDCEIEIPLDGVLPLKEEKDGRVRFSYTIELDSLDRKHFSDLFTDATENAPTSFGGDFTVTATLTAEGATPSSGSDTNNSLFAEGSGGDTAYIANLRHLQNLNKGTSKVDDVKTKAVQKSDIDCAVYLENDYTFTPIKNDKLASYDGGEFELRGLHAEAKTEGESAGLAGLFASVSGTADQSWEFKNIRMVNASAKGTGSVGALVGRAENAVFENCWVYWEPAAGSANLRGLLGDDTNGYTYQIIGNSAGGLAGQLTGEKSSITDCLAATLIRGESVAGGLVGTADVDINVTGSYADCYLSGVKAGGLAGKAETLTLKNCYAAGFIEITDEANGTGAGLCPAGSVTVDSVYSVVRCTNEIVDGWKPLASTITDDSTNYYYLKSVLNDEDEHAKAYTDMVEDGFVEDLNGESSDFGSKSSGDSHPYNLRTDLALTVYELPGLAKLPHYGDWSAQFTEASLVYYEQYKDVSYGFYGGGVNNLDDTKSIIKDGYAIAIRKDSLKDGSLTVTINGEVHTYDTDDLYSVTDADNEYFLAPLLDDLVNTNVASEQFYQKLSFAITGDISRDYYYCPHFAKTAVKADTEVDGEDSVGLGTETAQMPEPPTDVYVRTPRHLYMLSKHWEYYHPVSNSYTFRQELDMDYFVYRGYNLFQTDVAFTQEPVGNFGKPFNGVYDGGCHIIKNVVFKLASDQNYAGLFGYSSGMLRDIVYLMDADGQKTVSLGNHGNLYIGGLAGGNAGSIVNCAVANVDVTGKAYSATIYIGGLVGMNRGNISNCGTDCAALAADASSYANAYVGGLVGQNQNTGIISVSYAVGRASAEADTSSGARVCGFAGDNQGLTQNSYAAMDLRSSGKHVETYGFCGVTNGTQSETFFLNIGNFTYRDISYNASYTPRGAKEIRYDALTNREVASPVAGMSFIIDEDGFPYPTAVTDAKGKAIHYGQWPEQTELGVMGVYYWEKLEIEGVDATYHVSLLAVDPNEYTITKRTTLSNAHVDNGVVTDYGYGYYYDDKASDVTLTTEDIYYSETGGKGSVFETQNAAEAEETNTELAELMPGYSFHSYYSFGIEADKGGLYPAGKPNGTFTLKQGSVEVKFTLNPHFADALSVELPNDPNDSWRLAGGASTDEPGSKADNPYEVRALSQLQNINWNVNCNTGTPIEGDTNYMKFPYLSTSNDTGKYFWKQTHDLKGESKDSKFSPIAEYYDKTTENQGTLYGWFGGTYDGDDYVIENINIQGNESSCAGLFGVVYNGKLSSIILYSSDGQGKVASTTGSTESCWYAIGALAGIAASDDGNAIENCAVAGYTVQVNMKLIGGKWGGAEIGGLVGISNMDLQKCAAITTIDIGDNTESGNDNMRVGGLVGASQKAITNCYVGGNIRVSEKIGNKIAAIYIGGVVGGSYFKPLKPQGGTLIGVVGSDGSDGIHNNNIDTTNNKLENCYSYVTLPKSGDNKKIKALYALGGTGEINSAKDANAQWDDKANHGICTIKNSYYLDCVRPSDTDGIKTDVGTSGVTGLTYKQLAGIDEIGEKKIYGHLEDFDPVTAQTDDGFSVAGKYSFPAATNLQGLNYPFPTILTREDKYHVHYGDWPLEGIDRELGGAPIELDLFTREADDMELATHTETLKLEGVSDDGTWSVKAAPVITGETGEDGKPVTKDIVTAKIDANGNLTVKGVSVGVTTLTVTYTKDKVDYTLTLSVNVTAVLELRTADSPVHLFTNDTVGVELTAYGKSDSEGNTQELNPSDLGLEIMALAGVYDADMLNKAEMDGLMLNLITGSAEGDTTVSISYTYTYKDVEYTGLSAITFQVTEPEIELDEEENKRTVVFKGAVIDDFEVTVEGTLGEQPGKLEFDKGNGEFTLDMESIPVGTTVIVKVTLIKDGRRHVVTVTIQGEKQDEEGDEVDDAFVKLNLLTDPTIIQPFDLVDLENVETGGTWSVKAAPVNTGETDENGEPETKDIVIVGTNPDTGELTVTGVDVGVTTLTVTYTVGETAYTRLLSVNVIAMPDLRAESSPMTLHTGEKDVKVELTVYGKRGSEGEEEELDPDELKLKVTEVTEEKEDGDNLLENVVIDDGLTLKLSVSGIEGKTTVRVSYTYIYEGVEYTGLSMILFKVESGEEAEQIESNGEAMNQETSDEAIDPEETDSEEQDGGEEADQGESDKGDENQEAADGQDEDENPAEPVGEEENPDKTGDEAENPAESGDEDKNQDGPGSEAVVPTVIGDETAAPDESGDKGGDQDETDSESVDQGETGSGEQIG